MILVQSCMLRFSLFVGCKNDYLLSFFNRKKKDEEFRVMKCFDCHILNVRGTHSLITVQVPSTRYSTSSTRTGLSTVPGTVIRNGTSNETCHDFSRFYFLPLLPVVLVLVQIYSTKGSLLPTIQFYSTSYCTL